MLSRLRALFRRQQLEADMTAEMQAHLEMQEQANRAAGMSSQEAHHAARRQFGGVDQIKEQARDQRGWVWLEQIGKDLQLACRTLRRSPGFTAVAVALLALGIGANSAFFGLFKAHALAPFPYPDPDRVVQLWRAHNSRLEANPWSAPDFLDVHDQAASLAESGAFSTERFNLGGEKPEMLQGVACTPGVFRALGVQPLLGRWFADDDGRSGAERTVILSHACWTQRFGASPGLLGHAIRLNAQDYVVAGVMPADFEFYSPQTGAQTIDLWVPLQLSRGGRPRGDHWLKAVGRLKDGVTVSRANAELKLIADRLAAAYPDTNHGKWFYARPVPVELAVRELFGSGLVGAAVWLALIVACANLAIMLLARGAGRQTEYGVRLALGATRWRLVRLALAESLVLACSAAPWVSCSRGAALECCPRSYRPPARTALHSGSIPRFWVTQVWWRSSPPLPPVSLRRGPPAKPRLWIQSNRAASRRPARASGIDSCAISCPRRWRSPCSSSTPPCCCS